MATKGHEPLLTSLINIRGVNWEKGDVMSDRFNPEICWDTPIGRVCYPILSSPTVPWPPAEGAKADQNVTEMYAAMGVGTAHSSVFRKLRREFDAAGGDRKAFARRLVTQLKDSGQVGESEENDLLDIVDIVFKKKNTDAQARLRAVYERLIDEESSPMAIALAGIAVDSANFAAETGASEGPILNSDFMGGLAGAVITKHPLGAVAVGGTASFLQWW